MGLDSNNGIVHFAGLSYTRRVPKENILSDFSDGVVLVAYGFNYVDNTLINIDYLNIIMDSLPSNIDKIDTLVNKIPTENMKLKILVRDIVNINDFERARDSIKISNSLYKQIIYILILGIMRMQSVARGLKISTLGKHHLG